jgi:hypothetical protein
MNTDTPGNSKIHREHWEYLWQFEQPKMDLEIRLQEANSRYLFDSVWVVTEQRGGPMNLSPGAVVRIVKAPYIATSSYFSDKEHILVDIQYYYADDNGNNPEDIRFGNIEVPSNGIIQWLWFTNNKSLESKLREHFSKANSVSSDMNDRTKKALVTP